MSTGGARACSDDPGDPLLSWRCISCCDSSACCRASRCGLRLPATSSRRGRGFVARWIPAGGAAWAATVGKGATRVGRGAAGGGGAGAFAAMTTGGFVGSAATAVGFGAGGGGEANGFAAIITVGDAGSGGGTGLAAGADEAGAGVAGGGVRGIST